MNVLDLYDDCYEELSEQAKGVIEQTEFRIASELGDFENAQEFNKFVEENF